MARIAAIITDGFEDSEFTQPAKAFRNRGHEVVTVGLEAGKTVTGKRDGTEVEVASAVSGATVDDFDALFIPGGYSPDHLRVDPQAVQFAGDFVRAGKPVLAICHGGQLLISADVLKGRHITGYKSIHKDLENAGAQVEDRAVVVDGNLISSRNPNDIPAFIRESLVKLDTV